MGRSASCFKGMACGGSDPTKDNDDELEVLEVKSARHRWSFQKRSASHRVLNNSVLLESPAENKEIPECIDANTKATTDFDAVEKVSAIPCAVEKPQLSAPSEVKAPETVIETKPDIIEEEAIVIIQASIRAYMAQKELLKLRNVIKMQALVRGHLVRRHAVGTLRCVQAIVKMQALVRTRYASRLLEGSSIEKNTEEKAMPHMYFVIEEIAVGLGIGISGGMKTMLAEKGNVKDNANLTYISIERLLSNRFAQQLLESKPKTKPIHIKCDTSKTHSSWQWLERWMSASSSKQSPSMEASNEERISEVNEDIISHGDTSLTPEVVPCQPTSSHGETDTTTGDGRSDILASALKESEIDETPAVNESTVFLETEKEMTSNEISNGETDTLSVSVKSEGDIDQPRHSGKRVAPEQLVTDSRKSSLGSGRISNPEFTAALPKVEEMTSGAMSSGPASSSYQENGINSNVMAIPAEEAERNTSVPAEIRLKDNLASDNLLAQIGGSECDTELSISSTLDSPDRNEYVEKGNQMQIPDDEAFKTDSVEFSKDEVHTDHPEESADSISKVDNTIVVTEAVEPDEQEVGKPMPDLDAEVIAEATPQHNIPSPEASPRSHMAISESHGTPASQASVNTKGNRAEKSILSHKMKSLSAGKRSPSNPNQESSSSNSKEFSRDRKTTRRRSMKSEDTEQEPRDSNSNSNSTGSIPHFMQATESARAKLNANNSPRSSPDVLDRELNTKKRQYLTGVNGRQGSPRIRQQGGKVNGTQVQERKWVR